MGKRKCVENVSIPGSSHDGERYGGEEGRDWRRPDLERTMQLTCWDNGLKFGRWRQ